jgi:hypothetical protein
MALKNSRAGFNSYSAPMPKINDPVRLLDAIPSQSLQAGAVGVIVAEFTEPQKAYEVEFSRSNGGTICRVHLRPSQFIVLLGH